MKGHSTVLLLTALGLSWAATAHSAPLPADPQAAGSGNAEEQTVQSLDRYQALAATSFAGAGVELVDISSSDDELLRRLRESVRVFQERQASLSEAGGGLMTGRATPQGAGHQTPALGEMSATLDDRASCFATVTNLCLLGRFAIGAEFTNPYLGPELYRAGSYQLTLESGYMWWEAPTVMEVPIKMLNFCGSEGVFKVFAAGLTNFYVRIVILDAATGLAVEIKNPAYQIFNTVIGTVPFPC